MGGREVASFGGEDSTGLSICIEVASEAREACHVDVLAAGWGVRLSLSHTSVTKGNTGRRLYTGRLMAKNILSETEAQEGGLAPDTLALTHGWRNFNTRICQLTSPHISL